MRTLPTEIYTLSLHDALPIWCEVDRQCRAVIFSFIFPVRSRLLRRVLWFRSLFKKGFPFDAACPRPHRNLWVDRKSTRLNSSLTVISYAVFCLKKKKTGS